MTYFILKKLYTRSSYHMQNRSNFTSIGLNTDNRDNGQGKTTAMVIRSNCKQKRLFIVLAIGEVKPKFNVTFRQYSFQPNKRVLLDCINRNFKDQHIVCFSLFRPQIAEYCRALRRFVKSEKRKRRRC